MQAKFIVLFTVLIVAMIAIEFVDANWGTIPCTPGTKSFGRKQSCRSCCKTASPYQRLEVATENPCTCQRTNTEAYSDYIDSRQKPVTYVDHPNNHEIKPRYHYATPWNYDGSDHSSGHQVTNRVVYNDYYTPFNW